MSSVLIVVLSLISYSGGMVALQKVTPMLLKRKFDEVYFMGLAAAVIIGSLLVLAPVGVLFAYFNGVDTIRVFDIILLLILAGIAVRWAWRGFRPRYWMGVVRVSGILVGGYYIFLLGLTVYAIILLVMQWP